MTAAVFADLVQAQRNQRGPLEGSLSRTQRPFPIAVHSRRGRRPCDPVSAVRDAPWTRFWPLCIW